MPTLFPDEILSHAGDVENITTDDRIAHSTRAALERLATGPLSFWFLNHDLDEAELARQIGEFKKKGFAGFFLHPRGGLNVPYGSRDWNRVLKFCVSEARRVGLEAWLYDEDPYPSGTAGGRVVIEHPEYRATELVPTLFTATEGGTSVVDLPPGALVAAYSLEGGKIRRIDDYAGLVRSKWTQFHSMSSYYPPYQDGSPHWRAMTVEPHYRIPFVAEGAGSQLVAFTRREVVQSPWGYYTDLLNPDAARLFFEYTHEAYARFLAKDCGMVVPGIFTDEAKLRGSLPWSHLVPQWFFTVCGYNLWEKLPHLVVEIDGQTPFFRWAYRQALAVGFREAFFDPMASTCAEHKLLLTGHLSPEEDPVLQALCVPGIMGILGRMDIPGTDHIGVGLGSAQRPLLHLSPKLASSAAHGYGKRMVICEAFAVCDWAQDMAALTRGAHWLYALGVNRLVTHGQFYSIDGLRKREAPPSQFIQASYWEHFGSFSEMIDMLSRELTKGRHFAPLLVYYPEESFMASISGVPKQEKDSPELFMRRDMGELAHRLLMAGYDFDLADGEILNKVTSSNGKPALCEEEFEIIVVPGRHLTFASWKKLEALKAEGVKIILLEREVWILSDSPYPVNGEDLGPETLIEKLRETITPLWRSHGSLIGHKRITDDGHLLFLCNNGAEDFHGSVSLAFPGPYEICRPEDGKWWRASDLENLFLSAGLGVLIRTAEGKAMAPFLSKDQWKSLEVRWEAWESRFISDNCAVMNEFRVLSSKDRDIPPLKSFSAAPLIDLLSPTSLSVALGDGKPYRFYLATFNWQGDLSPVRLVCDTDLGVENSAFFLNRQELKDWRKKFTFDPMNRETDITSLIQEGSNHFVWREERSEGSTQESLPYDAVRLFGDFHAEFPSGRTVPALLRKRPKSYFCEFPAAAPQIGHAHYGGIVEYECRFHLKEAPRGGLLKLCFRQVFETMEVRINGAVVGRLWSAPYELEISAYLLDREENILTLACSCSPANYLQALSRPSGFLGPVCWKAGE